jgi:hypothetical protein
MTKSGVLVQRHSETPLCSHTGPEIEENINIPNRLWSAYLPLGTQYDAVPEAKQTLRKNRLSHQNTVYFKRF